jgi:hypothetical protein
MSHLNSHLIVIYVGLSFILGSLFGEFANNEGIITGAAFSAAFFALFDLYSETGKKTNKINSFVKQLFLILGVFSIVVLPHVTILINFINDEVNGITLMTLGIVISLMGFRHMKLERKVWESLEKELSENENRLIVLEEMFEENQEDIDINDNYHQKLADNRQGNGRKTAEH